MPLMTASSLSPGRPVLQPLHNCSRRVRRLLSRSQLRRACRQPCEQITLRRASQAPPQGPLLAPPHPHPSLRMRGPIVIHD
ncbi:metastasis-associated protein MTA1-like [Salmo trutta]|uniref:metastasis-associated protein MTA1-like n=1 Tax=Salmo trutta TaxID=8032 RepID=UPI001131B6AD|nr:metastasis-associated protein MTA1-like [Salmo trutta]XP_029560574.1 metastasis-associated protein MTA1-like [Salmo trutta]